ncbi:MAG: tRNA (N(6)-L-threonylcarbamoyladenosine(37)-C(2))-methylthiotransferase [Thermoplasmata archaeon]|nr:tRNA (N(6)-L-threonylcarbamoyladenosine(37)-C(2))-methylthiotransferase [Thermoplasmata archaeon]
MMKVYMEVYGCAANQGDASIMQGILMEKGYEMVENIEEADLLILTTCIVIDTTQQRMISRLKKFKETGKEIIVAGCMASALPDLIKKIDGNAKILPPRYIHHIADIIEGKNGFFEKAKVNLPRKIDIKLNMPIAEGCLYNCSYCITKNARGKLKSFSLRGLVEDAKNAIKKGCKEIRLTAQDTAGYGIDIKESLPHLINEIASIDENFRIRIGMMHPLSAYRILDDLIESYKNSKVYKFLHLPLQSASGNVLKAMRRGYDFDLFKSIVNEFRKNFRNSTFATDFIVAFPNESDDDFQQSMEALKELKPDITNITRFSPRPNTPAWKMKRLPTQIAKQRSRRMTKIAMEISYNNNKKLVGKMYPALLLEKRNGWTIGKTDGYHSIFTRNGNIGEFVKIKATDAKPTHIEGVIIQ